MRAAQRFQRRRAVREKTKPTWRRLFGGRSEKRTQGRGLKSSLQAKAHDRLVFCVLRKRWIPEVSTRVSRRQARVPAPRRRSGESTSKARVKGLTREFMPGVPVRCAWRLCRER